MKLLRVRIENFRLLKEVELDFSTDTDRNLSIIRAANESGKTTLLTALQWGLFDDAALPNGGRNFRYSPLDASSGERKRVDVSVELDFEAGDSTYRLIRSVTETVKGGDYEKGSTDVELFQLKQSGFNPMPNADAHIRPLLPKELREIFFTDGDRALSFIEGDENDQMDRVKEAIRSLLGLGVMEEALKHVEQVSRDLNRKGRRESENQDELREVSECLVSLQEEIPRLEEQINSAKRARQRLDNLEREADRKLSDALRKGNREELEKQRQAARRGREAAEKDAAQATRDHADLFKSEFLGKHLLAEPLKKTKEILDGLHRQGKIPNQTIPVLEDRLNQPTCICGEPLEPNDQNGQKRRKHIQHLIDESRNSDKIQEKVTELFYTARDLLRPIEGSPWIDKYNDMSARRERAHRQARESGEAESDVEAKIDGLRDVDTRQLRQSRDHYRNQSKQKQSEEIRLTHTLATKRRDAKSAEATQKKTFRARRKGPRA